MKPLTILLVAGACWLGGGAIHEARAQYVTYYRPVTTYYAPAPAYVPPAASYTVASPVVVTAPAPTVAYYPAPAPVPTVTYYRAPTVVYRPTPQVVTRYRPLLGRSVSTVRYGYAPVAY